MRTCRHLNATFSSHGSFEYKLDHTRAFLDTHSQVLRHSMERGIKEEKKRCGEEQCGIEHDDLWRVPAVVSKWKTGNPQSHVTTALKKNNKNVEYLCRC